MDEDRDIIIKALEALRLKADSPCPRCGKENLEITGISHIVLSKSANVPQIGLPGYYAPVALVVCKNCGYVMQHSLKVLGILSEAKEGV